MKVLDEREIDGVSGAGPLYERDYCTRVAVFFMAPAYGFIAAAALTGPVAPAAAGIAGGALVLGGIVVAAIAASNAGLGICGPGSGSGSGGWISGYDLIDYV